MKAVISKILNTADKKRLAGNFLSLIVLRGFQFLIPLITFPYLVRVVGLEKFGLINFALSLGLYFGAIIQYGFAVTATRDVARSRDDPSKVANIFSTIIAAKIILAALCISIFIPIIFYFDRFDEHRSLYLYTLAFVIFQSLFPVWFFQGIEKMKYIAFLSLGGNVIFLIFLFLVVKQEDDYIKVPLLNAFSALSIFLVAIIIIIKNFRMVLTLPKFKEIWLAYKNGYHAFVGQLAPNLYNNSSVFVLGVSGDSTMVGVYTAAKKVIDAIISLSYILSNSFLPYLSRNLDKHGSFEKIMLFSGILLSILTYFSSGWVASFMFGQDGLDVSIYIKALAVCVFLVFSLNTYGPNYLMLIGKDSIVRKISLYVSILFFGLSLVFIPLWGGWGAVFTLVGARFMMAILQFGFSVKYKGKFRYD